MLEIGCGPAAAARAIAVQLTTWHILAIDRSVTAITQAASSAADLIASGRLSVRRAAAQDFVLEPGEQPFDLFAARGGALDGRRPQLVPRACSASPPPVGPTPDCSSPATAPCRRCRSIRAAGSPDHPPAQASSGWRGLLVSHLPAQDVLRPGWRACLAPHPPPLRTCVGPDGRASLITPPPA